MVYTHVDESAITIPFEFPLWEKLQLLISTLLLFAIIYCAWVCFFLLLFVVFRFISMAMRCAPCASPTSVKVVGDECVFLFAFLLS